MSIFLGIDLGTQSLKLVAYDAGQKRLVQSESEPLDLISKADGSREQVASHWLAALDSCMHRLAPEHKQRVSGIGVSGQQHGFVPLGRDGSVLANVKLWCDTSTQKECDEISQRFGGQSLAAAQLGNPIVTGYTAPKVAWLKKHNAEAYAKLAHIVLPHDYLNYHLTGELFSECGDASGTGYLDIRARRYSAEMLHAIDPDRDLRPCLPELLDHKALIPISNAAASRYGLPEDVKVSVGGGDNMMAAFGTGAVAPGRLSLSLGTSGTLFAHCSNPAVDPRGELAAFCDSAGGWLPLLCTMNCTVATEKMRALLGLNLQQCDQLLEQTQPGSGGIVSLPFYNGERSPNLPNGRGCVFGMTMDNSTPGNLYRSAMEAASFGLRAGLDAFARAGQTFSSIRLTGGGAKSPHWRQMIADIFALPVEVPEQQEGAALGAALQALWAIGSPDADIAQLVDQHLTVSASLSTQPVMQTAAEYQPIFENYREHLALVSPFYTGESQ